jgi:hypothetical protein
MVQKSGWKLVGLRGDDGGSLFKDSAFDQLRRFLRNVSIHDVAFGGKEQAPHKPSAGCPCEPHDDGEDHAGERYAAWPRARPRPRPSPAGWPLTGATAMSRSRPCAPMGHQRIRTSGAEGAQRGGGLLRLTRLCSPTDALSEAGHLSPALSPFRRTRYWWGLLKPRMVHIARADQIDGCD